MATVCLMASRPGAFTKEGLIEGNPEAEVVVTPGAAYPTPADMALLPASKKRLLSVVADAEVLILQVSENETVLTADGVATRVCGPTSGKTSYACFLHPSTVGVYVKLA